MSNLKKQLRFLTRLPWVTPKPEPVQPQPDDTKVGHEFFVVMQKRKDGKVYADLHKCMQGFFLEVEEANYYCEKMNFIAGWEVWHVVPMLAYLQ